MTAYSGSLHHRAVLTHHVLSTRSRAFSLALTGKVPGKTGLASKGAFARTVSTVRFTSAASRPAPDFKEKDNDPRQIPAPVRSVQ